MSRHIAVVDPGVRVAEIASFNRMVRGSPMRLTYHLPALMGTDSLSQEPAGLAGILLLGSASSVHDKLPWQETLKNWLLPYLHAGVPTLGICFGHQFIAKIFDGEVGFVQADQKKLVGFRQVCLSPNRLWGQAELTGDLFVSHCETVVRVPENFDVVGRSTAVPFDALAHRTLPIWTFQSHPEATEDFAARRQATTQVGSFAFGHSLVKLFMSFAAAYRDK